jgi:hypothetical protein
MKWLQTRLVSAIGAAAMILSVPLVSMASWEELDYSDVAYACTNISDELSQILAITEVDADDVKVIYIEDILTNAELASIKSTLNAPSVQLDILTLQSNLKNIEIVNGRRALTFEGFLRNSHNNLSVSDVVAINAFEDGGVLMFGCKSCR